MSFFSKIANLINGTPSNPNVPNPEGDAFEGAVRSQVVTELENDDETRPQDLSPQEDGNPDLHLYSNFDIRPYNYDTIRDFL